MSTAEVRRPLHQRDTRFVEVVRLMSERLAAPRAGTSHDTPVRFREAKPVRRFQRPSSPPD